MTLGIFSAIAAVGFPSLSSWLTSSKHDEAKTIVADTLREAYGNAIASLGDQAWSVHCAQGAITLFVGTPPFVFGESRQLPSDTTLSCSNADTTFARAFGTLPANAIFQISTGELMSTITVYASGSISIQ